MAIIRANKDDGNFTQIANACIYDNRLSGMATGILLYMLSRPDDWQFYEDEVATHFSDGLAAVRAGIKRLMQYGYVVRTQKREKGKFAKYEYTIYEQPTEMRFSQVGENVDNTASFTEMRLSENGKTENGKSHTTNTDITNTDNTNKENNNGAARAPARHYNGSPNGEHHSYFSLKDLSGIQGLSSGIVDCMEWYGRLYQHLKGKEHPRLKLEQVQRVHDTIWEYFGEANLSSLGMAWNQNYADIDSFKKSAILYFQNVRKTDHNINHFATDGILEIREYEAPYQDIDETLLDL